MARRLIRGASAQIVPAARVEAERTAEVILREAHEEARRIVASAEARAAALLDEARAEAEARRERDRAEAARARDARIEESTRDVLELGLELARRITRRAFAEDPGAYAAMAEALIDEARIEGPGWLRVPEGVSLAVEGFDVVVDPSLAPGDLVIETEGARLDAPLDERLARLGGALVPPKTS